MTRYFLAFAALIMLGGNAAVMQQTSATATYINYDFSRLLKPRSQFLGFIGSDYERLRIVFTKIEQSDRTRGIFHVSGYSIVKGGRCDFSGSITIRKIIIEPPFNYSDDERPEMAGRVAEGKFIASYRLEETPSQKNAGAFSGSMEMDWYTDHRGQIKYDDLDIESDGYSNNQYTGIWTAYARPDLHKTANWGEYRIPNSGDLDVGAGGFYPDEKYKHNGWDDYDPDKR
jgi:hypothetical protein